MAGWGLLRRVVVEGRSMEPTLEAGDRLLLVRPLRGRRPRVGDIVAATDPRPGGRLLIKRVASVQGDRVLIEGDNQSSSTDSGDFGPVDRRAIVGRAVYRYGPPGRTGRLP